jgi:hypothetical protein
MQSDWELDIVLESFLANVIDDTETVTIGQFKVSNGLTKHQQTELVALLDSFRHLFVDDISDLRPASFRDIPNW